MDRSTKIKVVAVIAFGAVALLYPKATEKFRIVNPSLLELKISKNSPPLAILEDELLALETSIEPSNREQIVAGEKFNIDKFKKLKTPKETNQYRSVVVAVEMENASPVRKLGGLKLKKDSPNVLQLKKTFGFNVREIARHALQIQAQKKEEIKKEIETSLQTVDLDKKTSKSLSMVDFVNLSPHLRNRLEGVEDLDEVLNDDYSGENFEEVASALTESMQNARGEPNREPAVVGFAGLSATKSTNRAASASSRKVAAESVASKFGKNRVASSATQAIETPAKKHVQEKSYDEEAPEQGIHTVASRESAKQKNYGLLNGNINQAYFSGNIELKDGLVLGSDSQILVYRKIAGNQVSEGQFKISQGKYEIYIENPNTGTIVAELWSGQNILGKGEILLPEVLKNAKDKGDLQLANIAIRSLVNEVQVTPLSGYSTTQNNIGVGGARAVINDVVYLAKKNERVLKKDLPSSSVILKTQKEDHWGSICLGSTTQDFKPKLYHDKTVSALFSLSNKKVDKTSEGVIWGNIRVLGNNVAGAEVELLSRETYKPIYFNSFLPDVSLQSTSSNGEFAYAGLAPGSYIVRAKYKNRYLSPQVVEVQSGYVSEVNFDVEKPSLSEVFVFDIQTSEMLNAKLNFLGLEEFHNIKDGRKLIAFSGNKGLQFLEVTPLDTKYSSTRITVDKAQKEILVPLVPQAWLEELYARLKANYVPDSSVIIGLSQNQGYRVEMDAAGYNEETRILYFDQRGNWVQGAMETPKNGGFLISNANSGLRSVFIKYANQKDVKINTVIADSTAINVINP